MAANIALPPESFPRPVVNPSPQCPLAAIITAAPCSICGGERDGDAETVVGLFGNEDCTAFEKGFIVRPGTSSTVGSDQDRKIYAASAGRSCNISYCPTHAPAASSCTIHQSCLQLFMRHYTAEDDALDRLWLSCVWRRQKWNRSRPVRRSNLPLRCIPNQSAPTAQLDPDPARHIQLSGAFRLCIERCGMKSLLRLPQEVLDMIVSYVIPQPGEPPHYFWRCIASIDLSRQLSAAHRSRLFVLELTRVLSWERGSDPVRDDDPGVVGPSDRRVGGHAAADIRFKAPSTRPIIRLTIDSDGVRKIERLRQRPAFEPHRYDHLAFAVEEASFFESVIARFKDGLLHLEVPGYLGGLFTALWDTPTPPRISPSRANRTISVVKHFHTIDLRQATGITILYHYNSARAIHVHTQRRPCAQPTFDQLRATFGGPTDLSEGQEHDMWVYIPLSPKDTVLSCGTSIHGEGESHWQNLLSMLGSTRHTRGDAPSSFMFCTALAGEVVVGRDGYDNPRNPPVFHLNEGFSRALLYFYQYASPSHVYLTALHSEARRVSQRATPARWPAAHEFPQPHWHFSCAPLEGVACARVYYEPDDYDDDDDDDDDDGGGVREPRPPHCRGMVLEYENGGRRALGQCRVMVDRCKTFRRPRSIAFASTTVNTAAAPAKVEDPFPTPGEGGGTMSMALEKVRVWFDDDGKGRANGKANGHGEGEGERKRDEEEWSGYAMKGLLKFFFDAKQARIEVEGGEMLGVGA